MKSVRWDGQLASSLRPSLSLPQKIFADRRGSWAHDTMTRRTREEILGLVLRENMFTDSEILSSLEELDRDLAENRPLCLLTSEGTSTDRRFYRTLLMPLVQCGATWLSAPWLVVEFYFYRRILEACGYWLLKKDPFGSIKRRGLQNSENELIKLANRALLFLRDKNETNMHAMRFLVLTCLWGNCMDLSLWPEREASGYFQDVLSDQLLVDEFNQFFEILFSSSKDPRFSRVDIFTDNAGYELFTDVLLADFLLDQNTSPLSQVVFHLKSHPLFVSDATVDDFLHLVKFCEESSSTSVAELGRRWRKYIHEAKFILQTDEFATRPLAFWDMKVESSEDLRVNTFFVIVKGDANYRRLLGDRDWPPSTSFQSILSYFPVPLLALRTCKSELACGIPSQKIVEVACRDPQWQVNGRWGVLQFAEGVRNVKDAEE